MMKKSVFFLCLVLVSCGTQSHKTTENSPEDVYPIPPKPMFPLPPSPMPSFSPVTPIKKPQELFDRSIIRGKEFLLQKEVLKSSAQVRDFDAGFLAMSFASEPVATCQKILQMLLKGRQEEGLYAKRWRPFLSKILSRFLNENKLTAFRIGLPIPPSKESEETIISVLLQSQQRRAVMTFFFVQQKEGWRLTDVQEDWSKKDKPSSSFDPEELG